MQRGEAGVTARPEEGRSVGGLIALGDDDKKIRLYQRMQAAIRTCHTVDDCKEIADQATAIAAYYKQIKDDSSLKKFLEIKLRAWRRIGELLFTVDDSDCETRAAYIRKIKKAMPELDLHESAIRQALQIANVSDEFFEQHAGKSHTIYTIVTAYERDEHQRWLATPEGQKWQKEQREREERESAPPTPEQVARKEAADARFEHKFKEAWALRELRDEALREVGITLERHDRENMRSIVFLLKNSIHEVLRQAAFDHHTTMQAILRDGLSMWLRAHGYAVTIEEMDLRPRGGGKGKGIGASS
jgi:hypothetical protein